MPPVPISTEDALREAARLSRRGQTAEARRLYQAILRGNPGHRKARKALKALPADGDAAGSLGAEDFQRVDRMLRGGQLDEALAEVEVLCRRHPQQPALHNLRGVVLSRRGRSEDALESYHAALSLEPGFAEALNNLASAYSELQRYPEALRCYQRLVSGGGADAEVYANLATALRGNGQLEDAVTALKRALRLQPLFPDAHNRLGNLFNELGRSEEAVRAYRDALALKPEHRNALINLGRTLHAMGRYEQAETPLRQLLRLDAGDRNALVTLANTLRLLRRDDEARECFTRVLELRPGDVVARHMLSAMDGDDASRVADPAYARRLFDSYAANFEEEVRNSLGYSLPERVPAALERLDGEDAWYPAALDLGCGTGLLGPQIRPYCEQLTGVDISAPMLARAAEKAVYDALTEAEISSYLRASEQSFDLLTCTDVVIYLGALEAFFAAVASCCSEGARVVLSTETLDEGDLRLRETGRYAHSLAYVTRCAEAAGLAVVQHEIVQLRKDRDGWIDGGLYLFTPRGS